MFCAYKKMKHTNEIKIGAFVISGLVLLLFGWAFLREFTIHKQQKFTVVFNDVAGLTKGSFVLINGLRVGRVDRLILDTKENKVLVEARIQLPDILIPRDSKIYIRTSGYVGDKYLDITLGKSGDYIKEGDLVYGEATFDSFKSLEKVSEIVNQIEPTELGKNIQELAGVVVGFLKKADSLTENTNKIVRSLPQGKDFTKLVTDAYNTVEKLNIAIGKVEQISMDESAQKGLTGIISQASEVSSDLRKALEKADSLANNKEAFDSLNDLLIRASKIVEQLDELRADPLIQNELRETLENTKTAAKKVSKTSDEVSDVLHQRFLLPRLWFGKLLPKGDKASLENR